MSINRITKEDIERFKAGSDIANDLDVYQLIATKSAIYPGKGTPKGIQYVALKMNGEAGELAEHVGKAMRDDGFGESVTDMRGPGVTLRELTPHRKDLIIKEIGDELWYLSAMCNELGIKLSEAASTNLEKLADRTRRDELRGSGDER